MASKNNGGGTKLSPAGKAAAVIVALGAEGASQIYKHLREDEIEKISLEVAKLEKLPPETLQEVVEDFYGLCVTQKVISDGGVVYARDVLEKAFGPDLAASYMDRISSAMQTVPFDFIRKANYRNLMMMIQNEHPQTIAFVLSYVKAEQAASVISELPRETQLDVIERIAQLESVSPEIVSIVEDVLRRRFSAVVSVDMAEIGGVNYVADIMNHTERATEKYIFDELNKKNPELSDNIRKLMFVFEDITKLDDMTIQRVLREVDSQDLAVAIKGSTNEEVRESLLGNMSARAKQNIITDMEYLRNVRMRDVEEAQQKIVNIIRSLEETGEIVISRGGEDEIIA
ncbi:MAG: flagellar motor switch protein FliG [Oscillospiraceae bacterium]|jgi:flagellar motor switch protein FliG|nr:flagellar motor switch protein FliG [Oscillospiraceae bacterium]